MNLLMNTNAEEPASEELVYHHLTVEGLLGRAESGDVEVSHEIKRESRLSHRTRARSHQAIYQLGRVSYTKAKIQDAEDTKPHFLLAKEYYTRAAKQGHTEAQFQLANLQADGQGGDKDFTAAREWYEKAAKRGHVRAQYNLGLLYSTGLGLDKEDLQTARKWFKLAAAQNHAASKLQLGDMAGEQDPDRDSAFPFYPSGMFSLFS